MAALFSGATHVRRMLDFEAALARAEARAGVVPAEAADAIAAACRIELFDVPALLSETALAGLLEIGTACAALAERHRATPMAGRTLLQQALPITFGLKAARWLALVTRQVRALREQRARSPALQFGGAAGTL